MLPLVSDQSRTRDIIQLLRPQQWVKNGVVLAGLIFSGSAHDPHRLLTALAATGLFCLLSSAVYIINDLADAEADRNHPIKAHRPIAAGRITPRAALTAACLLGLVGLGLAAVLDLPFFGVAAGYLALNLLYSLWLKHIVIIDVMCIAAGFVLRAVAGAVVIKVLFSGWLLIASFLLALFLGFGKRRHELILLENGGVDHRRILKQYSSYFLDQLIGVVTPAVLVCYLIYVISPEVTQKLHTQYLYLTVPFVIYGLFRYLYLIHQEERGGSPTEILLTDRPLLGTVVLWLATVFLLLYVVAR
ncbi:MAG: decaprenyl-phosphate phosphoribosyltransferase [candidate division Zixibacteria bacterium]|nr:decaprenyl-phosphate phosphoribosyltransferase [candidate division Zixibacteria bacterium]